MDRLRVAIPYLLAVAEFDWGIFIPRVAVATMVLILALTWSAWLWFIVCRREKWAAWVQREHDAMRRLGLPQRWSGIIFRLQTGWFMPTVIFVTTVLSICVLHLL
jgi:hypothetical protein